MTEPDRRPTAEQPAIEQPEVTPAASTERSRSPWHYSRIPSHLGRARTSTVVLTVLFLAVGTLYLNIRPDPPGRAPTPETTTEQPAPEDAPAPETTPETPATTPPTTPSRTTSAPAPTTGTSEPGPTDDPDGTTTPEEPTGGNGRTTSAPGRPTATGTLSPPG